MQQFNTNCDHNPRKELEGIHHALIQRPDEKACSVRAVSKAESPAPPAKENKTGLTHSTGG